MLYTLPDLPYSFDALEPHIDAKTMEIHHDKHHAAYVANLNKALEGHDDLGNRRSRSCWPTIDTVPEDIRTAVRNHGGGHANHCLFWTILSSKGGRQPTRRVGAAASTSNSAASTTSSTRSPRPRWAGSAAAGPGSASIASGRLLIESTANQDSP